MNRHTKVYNRVFRQRSMSERRWASVWHWELPKKKQVGSLYKRIVYSVGIPNDSHLLVLIRCFTKTGVLWLWSYWRCQVVRASEDYTNGRLTSTGTGVPYKRQRPFVRAFSGNFTMTRTIRLYVHTLLKRFTLQAALLQSPHDTNHRCYRRCAHIYVVNTHSWSMHAHLGCQRLCTPWLQADCLSDSWSQLLIFHQLWRHVLCYVTKLW